MVMAWFFIGFPWLLTVVCMVRRELQAIENDFSMFLNSLNNMIVFAFLEFFKVFMAKAWFFIDFLDVYNCFHGQGSKPFKENTTKQLRPFRQVLGGWSLRQQDG